LQLHAEENAVMKAVWMMELVAIQNVLVGAHWQDPPGTVTLVNI